MRQAVEQLTIRTDGEGLVDITAPLGRFVAAQGIAVGLLTVWCRHTSASLIVQENADPLVRSDLLAFFRRLVPQGPIWRHADEGPDDMPAHVKAALTLTQLSIPVMAGELMLGTWQAVYLFEHRTAPHRRELALHLWGE
jgi:secondary thiamine-phosphate synthase enzyme